MSSMTRYLDPGPSAIWVRQRVTISSCSGSVLCWLGRKTESHCTDESKKVASRITQPWHCRGNHAHTTPTLPLPHNRKSALLASTKRTKTNGSNSFQDLFECQCRLLCSYQLSPTSKPLVATIRSVPNCYLLPSRDALGKCGGVRPPAKLLGKISGGVEYIDSDLGGGAIGGRKVGDQARSYVV
jgi:hypothetical protein